MADVADRSEDSKSGPSNAPEGCAAAAPPGGIQEMLFSNKPSDF
jgi:hypothetical protein